MIERLIEIRADAGYSPLIYLFSGEDIKTYLDAYGFDVFELSDDNRFELGDYQSPFAPGGDVAHSSLTAH